MNVGGTSSSTAAIFSNFSTTTWLGDHSEQEIVVEFLVVGEVEVLGRWARSSVRRGEMVAQSTVWPGEGCGPIVFLC